MKIKLIEVIFSKIVELGGTESKEAQEFFGKSATVLQKWSSGSAVPDVFAGQRVLDDILAKLPVGEDVVIDTTGKAFGQPVQGKTRPDAAPKQLPSKATTTEGSEAERNTPLDKPVPAKAKEEPIKNVNILCPTNREFNFCVVLSMLGQWKSTLPEELRKLLPTIDIEPDTVPHRGRNILATRFLNTKAEWSFWIDSDIVAPIGNPAWFEKRTGIKTPSGFNYSALERLTKRGKTLIGGVYVERGKGKKVIAQPGFLVPTPKKEAAINADIKKGIQDKIVEVGWIGFGCVAVHRKVFEDILDKVEGVRATKEGTPHGFFTAFEEGPQGEDVAFCKRAAMAGHKTFLDLSVVCGHIGRHVFIP